MDDTYWEGSSHITSYSSQEVSVLITEDFPETDYDSAKVYVQCLQFPRNEFVSQALSNQFERSNGSHELTIEIDLDDEHSTAYHYIAALVPGDTTLNDINNAEMTSIMETDPFVFSDEVIIERDGYEGQLDDDSGDTFSRNSVEGAYQIEVSGRTFGKDWTVQFFAYKSAHADALNRSRGRSRPEYVSYELTDGTAEELASILMDEADARDYDDAQAVEFVIDFVQALPYVPDDVSRGFDDYTKFIMETVPEMAGDCEDTAILLASILEADPFGYDMILIQPPGHMAAGIWQSEPSGWYWELNGRKYSYIETTGRGWGVGDCPDEFQGEQATLHQV